MQSMGTLLQSRKFTPAEAARLIDVAEGPLANWRSEGRGPLGHYRSTIEGRQYAGSTGLRATEDDGLAPSTFENSARASAFFPESCERNSAAYVVNIVGGSLMDRPA